MCTLIVLHRCYEASPLVVAANRDEFFERPAEGPALRHAAHAAGSSGSSRVRVLSPRDVQAGGTWLGLNEHGLFAAITNRRRENPDPNMRSRGLIVMDALSSRSAREAADEMESLESDAYNPFNLLVADGRSAHVVTYAGAPVRIDLAPGAHVIGNVHPQEQDHPKTARQRAEVARVAEGPEGDALASLGQVCASHAGEGPLESTCVHTDAYGTRSSMLLRLGDEPRLAYADGPPCRSAYRDCTRLLTELDPKSPRSVAHPSMRKVS